MISLWSSRDYGTILIGDYIVCSVIMAPKRIHLQVVPNHTISQSLSVLSRKLDTQITLNLR